MSGAASLGGLVYQQSYLTFRVVSGLGQQVIDTRPGGSTITQFAIEGRTSGDAPVWDIWIRYGNGTLELVECKNTAIEANDRRVFYGRLRREVASGIPTECIRPVWVTNPEKQTPKALRFLEGMPAQAADLDFASVPTACPRRVDSVRDALQEAIFCLCHDPELDEKARRCTEEEARAMLKQIRVDCHRFEDLEQAVRLLVTGVLTRGTGQAVNDYVTGVLTNRIVAKGEARFTVEELLDAVGTTAIGVEVEGRIRDLLSFNAASGFVTPARLIRWSCLPEKPTTRWGLAERLPAYQTGVSCLLIAGMGIGKTVASFQALEEEAGRRHPSRVLRVEARSLGAEELDALMRLACMLSGNGSAWLAIDGLDEIPVNLLAHWERAMHALAALPNLVLLATVRREVLAVREQLAKVTASLVSVEIAPLACGQVEKAFSDAGLPVPRNRPLIRALQNPFILSLYADIVSPEDMPLAESGDVTAFRVIDEFWRRRVRGLSIGLRAVGESEASHEPKRLAAVFLSERSLAGDISIARTSEDPRVSTGIEMLLREGVIREHGAGAVAWVHDWLREYAMVDRLLADVADVTAVNLARVVAGCQREHVSRVAAAGGAKWVVAQPACGSPSQYLSELWLLDKGLAREALVVLLEGPSSSLAIADLPDSLILEAITLAVHLRATQWGDQVASLPEERFLADGSDELHAIAVEYELTIALGGGRPTSEAVVRLVSRDLRRLQAGRVTYRKTIRLLFEHIKNTEAYRDSVSCEWLELLGKIADEIEQSELLKMVSVMIAAGEFSPANTVFRAVLGFTNTQRGEFIAGRLASKQSLSASELERIVGTPGLVSGQPEVWGVALVELLALLIQGRQKEEWPQNARLGAALANQLGVAMDPDQPYAPDFDEDPRISCRRAPGRASPIVHVAIAVEQGLRELTLLDDPEPFRRLAALAISLRFAGVVTMPLLALYDAIRGTDSRKDWHTPLAFTLLRDEAVRGLKNLSDVRRLLVRLLISSLDQSQRAELAESIRRSMLPDAQRLAELAELRDAGVLTASEAMQVDESIAAGEVWEATDPRQSPLFSDAHWESSEVPEAENTGWPYPEDESHVRFLMRPVPEAEKADATKRAEWLARQLEVLGVVLLRDEARSETWIGMTLGSCRSAVEELRRSVERPNDDERHEKLASPIWYETVEKDAKWWRQMAEAALGQLSRGVPASHAQNDRTGPLLTYMSDDVVYNSLELLDELLAIDPGPPFAEYQRRFDNTVGSKWGEWPAFTKATALNSVRAWFWLNFPGLRTLLAEAVRTEQHPLVVNNAVRRSACLARFAPAPELRDFLGRSDVGAYEDGLRYVARLLGEASILAGPPEGSVNERAMDIHRLLDEVLARNDIDADVVNQVLDGVLWGAADYALNRDAITPALADTWLRTVEQVISNWRFDRCQSGDGRHFPIHALSNMMDGKSSLEVRQRVFRGIIEAFEMLIRQGSLVDFCAIHFNISTMISGRGRPTPNKASAADHLAITEEIEGLLLKVCRASVDRVSLWKRQGKTTEDLGWIRGLNGIDSVDLIKTVFDASRDRDQFERDLAPLADILADAGLQGVAADLRAHLRRVR